MSESILLLATANGDITQDQPPNKLPILCGSVEMTVDSDLGLRPKESS